jgi:hypothetical protein
MAAERNIYVRQGNTFTHSVVLWDGYDDLGNKVPMELSEYTFASDIREAGEDGPLSEPGEEILASFSYSVDENIVTLTLSSEDSEEVPPGKHWYDIQSKNGDGIITTLLSGTIIFLPRVA